MTLKELYYQMDEVENVGFSDKGDRHPSHNHFYIDIYDKLFNPLQNDAINLLEIGISTGASLDLWSKFFTNGTITGLDKNKPLPFDYLDSLPNVNMIFGMAYDPDNVNYLLANLPQQDIIIDDGSHLIEDQIQVLFLYHQLVKPGGYFIIEDIHIPHLTRLLTEGVHRINRLFTTTVYDYHRRPRGLADDVMMVLQFMN